jgi:excisionase family DNA binding protein
MTEINYLPPAVVAQRLGVSKSTVIRAIKSGRMLAKSVMLTENKQVYLIDEKDLEKFNQ